MKRLGSIVGKFGSDGLATFVKPESDERMQECEEANKRLVILADEYQRSVPLLSRELRRKLGLLEAKAK